jgi:hypothetical protein
VTLNGTTIIQAGDVYHYLSYLETILTYGSDAAVSHLTNAFWYLDDGDMLPTDPSASDAGNKGLIKRWDHGKQSKKVKLYGRIHSDICNFPQYVLPGVRLQMKLTKSKSNFYLMNKEAGATTKFKI